VFILDSGKRLYRTILNKILQVSAGFKYLFSREFRVQTAFFWVATLALGLGAYFFSQVKLFSKNASIELITLIGLSLAHAYMTLGFLSAANKMRYYLFRSKLRVINSLIAVIGITGIYYGSFWFLLNSDFGEFLISYGLFLKDYGSVTWLVIQVLATAVLINNAVNSLVNTRHNQTGFKIYTVVFLTAGLLYILLLYPIYIFKEFKFSFFYSRIIGLVGVCGLFYYCDSFSNRGVVGA